MDTPAVEKRTDWVARSDALAVAILERRGGAPLDVDAILRTDRAILRRVMMIF